jgi:deoxyribonuclease V
MIYAFDVYYSNNIAQAVAIGFDHWTDSVPKVSEKELIINIEEYVPGEFYKRELPCILKVLGKLRPDTISTIVVDGYVQLDDKGTPGLGGRLYQMLQEKIPVVGVAKKSFADNHRRVREVLRGQSLQPLYVTSAGIDVDDAAANVRAMHGDHRIPTLLKQLDTLSRR